MKSHLLTSQTVLRSAFVCQWVALTICVRATTSPSVPAPKLSLQVVPVTIKLASEHHRSNLASWDSEDVTPVKYPPVPTDLGSGVTEMLDGALTDSNRFRVFEKSSGAQYRVQATITAFKWNIDSMAASLQGDFRRNAKDITASVIIDADVYDLTSGKVAEHLIAAGRASGSFVQLSLSTAVSGSEFQSSPIGEATRNAVQDLVTRLNRRSALPWRSTVAAVQQPEGQRAQIYFSGGSASAISKGYEFTILRAGKPTGHCTVVEVQQSLCLAEITDGTGIQVGDAVVFEPKKRTP